MQIAENLVKSGITSSNEFNKQLTQYAKGLTKIIETGTNYGTGTTMAILNGLGDGSDFDFYSIEVNPQNFLIAQKNLGKRKGLHLLNGLSVSKGMIPVNATFEVPEYIIVDHQPAVRDSLYLKEVTFNVPDNQLDFALRQFDYKPELVCLDSAGNMGLIEFHYLMNRVTGGFILALDDTCHVKHYETMEYIKSNSDQFKILWSVESEYLNPQSGSKFGAAIIQVW